MKPAPFDYARPVTLDEACSLLAEAAGGASVIAGGQTLMPLLNLRMSEPLLLIDLGGISELRGVTRLDGASRVGPMTTQAEALGDETLCSRVPVLAQALRHVGHHQTRNRGTVGGSIAFGEPAAECPAVAVALGAKLHLQSTRGRREVAAEDFYFGPYSTALEADEILTAIDFPDWPQDHIPVFREVARRPGDFALTGLCGALAIENGLISLAGLAWIGMGPVPMRMKQVEEALVGSDPARLDIAALADLAIADSDPFDDKAASAAYRRSVGRKLFVATLRDALDARVAA